MSVLTPVARVVARALVIVAALALLPAAASAGTYKQYTCKLPDGSVAGTDGWAPDAGAAFFQQTNNCPSGGALGIVMSGAGLPADGKRYWHWTAPAGIQLHAFEMQRAFLLAPGGAQARPTYRATAGPQLLEDSGSAMSVGSLGTWNHPANRFAVADPTALAANGLDLLLGCLGASGSSCPNTGATDSELRIHAATFTLAESIAPVVTNPTGSLTSGTPKQGIERLTFGASDAESGVYRALLDVDGAPVSSFVVDANAGRCADPVADNGDPYEFQYRTPCKAQVDGVEVPLDTRLLSDGTHLLRVRVEDAAGNRTPVYGPATIAVANGASAPQAPAPANATAVAAGLTPNGVGASAAARLSTFLHGRLRVRYGRAPRLTGRLLGPSGAPIPGALIDVFARTRVRGARLVRAGAVTTDAAGAFSYTAPVGASRLVRFAYRAHVEDTNVAQTSDVDLMVVPRLQLRVSPRALRNGQTARYRGTIAGPNTKGGLAEIRARTRGRWVTVCVARIRSAGRFGCPYRFRNTARPTTYVFRAVVRRQSGLPYEGGTSPRRSVRVRP